MGTHEGEGAACKARRAPEENGGGGEARPTAKDPNRRPNGIRFGDLVGGLRRPPAATTASARSYSPSTLLPHDLYTDILTSYSHCRRRRRQAATSMKKHRDARLLPCGHVRADSSQGLSNAPRKIKIFYKQSSISTAPLNTKWPAHPEIPDLYPRVPKRHRSRDGTYGNDYPDRGIKGRGLSCRVPGTERAHHEGDGRAEDPKTKSNISPYVSPPPLRMSREFKTNVSGKDVIRQDVINVVTRLEI
ncbi:Uncharacterized protein DBV15_06921 [Temnothorax longispinosus]|uniref:Uncharacterized protein n=1 Tax=Temnothorax longispinosus TaxID=300112 RepID=A0A4S2KLZ6_9HYME|nr:Uncharacterized protein DBV15_06921 [Temnothorax longispinosus]